MDLSGAKPMTELSPVVARCLSRYALNSTLLVFLGKILH